MSLIDRVAQALFGDRAEAASVPDQALIDELVEAIVDIIEARVRLRKGYRDQLGGGMRATIGHLRALGRALPKPRILGRAAWSQDPHVRAFFVSADDVSTFLGRSREARRFFDEHPECGSACALLAMKREERRVLAPRMEGGVMRQDVPQTTISFGAHRLMALAADEPRTRLDIGRRIVARLAQLVLARLVAVHAQAKDVTPRHAFLAMKLRMLQQGGDGMQALVGEPSTMELEIADVRRALEETTASGGGNLSSLLTMDGYIQHINAVFGRADQYVRLTPVHLRVTLLGTQVDEATSGEVVNELELSDLFIGEGLSATIALVRVPREEMPPKEDLLAQAERLL